MKIERLIISNNNNNNGVEYVNLVNSIANIQEFKEVYICVDKFQCLIQNVDNITIKLDGIQSSYENHGTFINNSKKIDSSVPKIAIPQAPNFMFIHDLQNCSENWIKINSLENLNRLRFKFETIDYTNMTTTDIIDIHFTLHLKIKLL